jgi:ubiquinone/menaquinone biosynthesis C-methylase UbiE
MHPDTPTKYFDRVAPEWDELRATFFSDRLRELALDAAGVEPGGRAADLGAGTGFLTEGLLGRGLSVIAVDPSPAMLGELGRKLGPSPALELREGSLERLPLADGAVGYAFANMVLHHVEDPPAAIGEMARVLAPGGRLVITDLDEHDHEFLRTEQHDRWLGFRRDEVAGWLAAAGLERVRVEDTGEHCCAEGPCDCGCDTARIRVFLASAQRPAAGDRATGEAGAAHGHGDRPTTGPKAGPKADQRTDPAAGDAEALRAEVRRHYGAAAKRAGSGCGSGCGAPADVAGGLGAALYAGEDVSGVPASAVGASLGCANPVALADLAPGEVVLDLGSGAGLDVLLSARRVGPSGKAYGLDMTPEMLELARRHQREAGVDNAEFLEGTLEDIPLPAASVDVVLSNCVINLSPDKDRVFAEVLRVLRPGGRLAVADVVAIREVPQELRRRVEAWVGCLAGTLGVDELRRKLDAAGFAAVDVEIAHTWRLEDFGEAGTAALTGLGVGAEALSGAFASAFVRAVKPEAAIAGVA